MNFAGVSQSLGSLTLFALAGTLLLGVLLLNADGRDRLRREFSRRLRLLLGISWLVVSVATAGSLYFSDIVGLPPCLLCWYQRIAMYPLVLLLGLAWLARDDRVWRYALPLSGLGFLTSLYHYVIQWRPALDVVTCEAAAPCTARYLAVFGFMSIPFMAGAGFAFTAVLMLAVREIQEHGSEPR